MIYQNTAKEVAYLVFLYPSSIYITLFSGETSVCIFKSFFFFKLLLSKFLSAY